MTRIYSSAEIAHFEVLEKQLFNEMISEKAKQLFKTSNSQIEYDSRMSDLHAIVELRGRKDKQVNQRKEYEQIAKIERDAALKMKKKQEDERIIYWEQVVFYIVMLLCTVGLITIALVILHFTNTLLCFFNTIHIDYNTTTYALFHH